MRIAIIGAGFTGLSAAYQLTKQGYDVTVYEKDTQPGGLAIGYQEKDWEWTLEKHYHHWFTNDDHILHLAKEIEHPVIIKRPQTSVFVDDKIYQLDSPLHVLTFPKLSLLERIRMGIVLGFLKYDPFWKPLEHFHTTSFLKTCMGEKSYKMIWEPQLKNKFGKYMTDISLAWFWARIAKRTSSLAYPKGGFLSFANHLVKKIEEKGGRVDFETETEHIESIDEKIVITTTQRHKRKTIYFDKAIVTLPSFLFLQLTPQLPDYYKEKLSPLKGLGATNLVLRLQQPFFSDKTYWLSVTDASSPIMAIVEHTNFMDKKHYNNEHLVYLGNYLEVSDPNFSKTKEQLLALYDPFLKKINPDYKKNIIGYELFKAPFAQPIVPINYSTMIPDFKTPLKNVYLANMQQVYPWDRGTNYAVQLGEKVAKLVVSS